MALVVEDGTALANSNSYGNTTSADAYYVDMGYSETSTDGSLIRGARGLDDRYRLLLKGEKTTSGQAMAWPRDGMEDEDGNSIGANEIPNQWIYAAFEMARALAADQTATADSSVKRAKAGSVEVEFSSPLFQRSILSKVDELVVPYITGGGNRVVRA